MTEKLNWSYDTTLDCEVATHNGYRIRAPRDDCAHNPFEEDGHWPMAVYHDRSIDHYCGAHKGHALANVLERFSDLALQHDQIALAKVAGVSIDDEFGKKYLKNVEDIAWLFRPALEEAITNLSCSKHLQALSEVYDILGVPNLLGASTGYCQGDWAEVLIVALPEVQEEFGCTDIEASLQAQLDLYSAWAWGDVYGFVVERPIFDEDGGIDDWEEVEAGSCWGFYGSDHHESGLEDAALAAVPDEPVVFPDNALEDV